MRIAVSLKLCARRSAAALKVFQSAVRIAVSLKWLSRWLKWRAETVSIRRADRCLAEAFDAAERELFGVFQSAVRIAVSLKWFCFNGYCHRCYVSIRRADRCLAEGLTRSRPRWRPSSFNPPCGSLSR